MLRTNTRLFLWAARVALVGACFLVSMASTRAAARRAANDTCRTTAPAAQRRLECESAPTVTQIANFRISGLRRQADAAWCAQRLEALRKNLQERWLGSVKRVDWSPKCDIVVHGSLDSYLRHAGAEAKNSLGASRIALERGRVAARRIDVRADKPGWFDAVMPHELTHIVLADEFPQGTLPAWADEGMAVMADSPMKQALHLRDYHVTRTGRVSGTLTGFMTQRDYPCGHEIPAFYGRSVSLVRFLVDRKSPAEFVRFLHCAETRGYDAALRDCYGIDGAAALERQWR